MNICWEAKLPPVESHWSVLLVEMGGGGRMWEVLEGKSQWEGLYTGWRWRKRRGRERSQDAVLTLMPCCGCHVRGGAGLLPKMLVQFWKGSTGQPTRPLSPARWRWKQRGLESGRGTWGRGRFLHWWPRPRWEEMEPIRELFTGRKERRGPRVKPQKPEGLKPSWRASQKARKFPRACDNLDLTQEIMRESRQWALSPVTCVCILIPPLKFTCPWVHYLSFLSLAWCWEGLDAVLCWTSFSQCPACRRSSVSGTCRKRCGQAQSCGCCTYTGWGYSLRGSGGGPWRRAQRSRSTASSVPEWDLLKPYTAPAGGPGGNVMRGVFLPPGQVLNWYNLESQIPERNGLFDIQVSPAQHTCGLRSCDAPKPVFY